jgi:hypothetical protein
MRLVLIILYILVSASGYAQSHTLTEPADSRVKLYLDCDDCNSTFFRRNLAFVDFVRDAKLADIHVFVTEQRTGGNGTEYGLNFIGVNQYSDLQYRLETVSPQDETDILKWERLLKIVDIGLLPYVSRTAEIDRIEITHDVDMAPIQESIDPWNYWVFRLELSTEFDAEESKNDYSLDNAIRVDRIMEMVKFRSKLSYDLDKEIYNDQNETIETKREEAEFETELVYSLNPRWSAGFFSEISKSSYLNLSMAASMGPAIEYNIFPWDKSDRKVFTIGYHLRANYFTYNELTIYDKLDEWRASQALELSFMLRQPWGEIENSLEASHYFHDYSKNRFSLETDISVNILKGLSLFMELETELIHDQLYLPAGETTREEILLKQRKLATNFEISAELGVRFTFGSVYNNIVNQRL